MSFNVGSLCTGSISVWLSLVGPRHKHAVPFGFGTVTKLLHHLAISYTPSCASIWYCCSLSSSFLNGSCSTYAVHLGSTWYSYMSSLTYGEKVPLKYPIPLSTSLFSLYIKGILMYKLNKVQFFSPEQKNFLV